MRFIWKIENFNCMDDEVLESPSFLFQDAIWEVRIYLRNDANDDNNNVQLHQFKAPIGGTFKVSSLNCAVAFLDGEGLPLIWLEKKNVKLLDYTRNVISFPINKDEVFGESKTKFLSIKNLTVQCIFWERASEFATIESLYALTRIEPLVDVRDKTFTLNIPEVSSIVPQWNMFHDETLNGEYLKIDLSLNDDETFEASLRVTRLPRIHAKCTIFILDATGKEIQFADKKYYFREKGSFWDFETNITKDLLLCYRHRFLHNDSLSLIFKCSFSCKVSFNGKVSANAIFENSPNPISNPPGDITKTRASSTVPVDKPPNTSSSTDTISQAVKDIYEEGFLSDFSLRVQDRTFPVHKIILGARSSVFRAMFTADMKEKESGHVDIQNMDPDTIQRMLQFVYSDSVQEHMQWESASNLYAAADKYALQSLKQRCSDLLNSGLSASSVLGVLVLADSHQDHCLKDAALDFIGRHDKDIIGSEPWNKFAVENAQLAFDTIQKLYLKKIDV